MARIDAPLLDDLIIDFFCHSISDTTQIAQFIGRTPNFEAYDHAEVVFACVDAWVVFERETSIRRKSWLKLGVMDYQPDELLPFLVQICTSSFPRALIATLKRLYLLGDSGEDGQLDNIEINQWSDQGSDLLRPFTGLKLLYMDSQFEPYIPLALQGLVGESVTEVLFALQTLFLEIREKEDEPLPGVQDSIGQFVAARQRAGHPIDICRWFAPKYC